ncbi:MAG: hypothetical protein QOD39_390 [Mycobacterium sp.]|nr:hypothetical protein [Mycobacterium sp.]
MRNCVVAMRVKSRGLILATAKIPNGPAWRSVSERRAARLHVGRRCFAWASATSGTAADIEAQRPFLQHPCCSAGRGAAVQQIDNVNAATANTALIAVRRIHVRLFTQTT